MGLFLCVCFVLFCFTVAVCVFKVVFASFWCPCGGFCLFFCLLFLASLQLDYMSLLSLFCLSNCFLWLSDVFVSLWGFFLSFCRSFMYLVVVFCLVVWF